MKMIKRSILLMPEKMLRFRSKMPIMMISEKGIFYAEVNIGPLNVRNL
jgi:hypothetical protein